MKVEIDNDLILPFIIGALAVIIPYFYNSIMLVTTHNRSVKELQSSYEISQRNLAKTSKTLEVVTKELQSYEATEQSLMSLGASSVEAKRAILAAEVYGLNPKP
jgi:glutamate synthase domain-containing protein 2